jgi:hypothetical protein
VQALDHAKQEVMNTGQELRVNQQQLLECRQEREGLNQAVQLTVLSCCAILLCATWHST